MTHPVEHARRLHESSDEKARWSLAIREQIRKTLVRTGTVHADDLFELGVPEEHRNLVGAQLARCVNVKLIEEVGRRKCEHPAANGRKAGVYKPTELGKKRLGAGLAADSPRVIPPRASPSRVSGESGVGWVGDFRRGHLTRQGGGMWTLMTAEELEAALARDRADAQQALRIPDSRAA